MGAWLLLVQYVLVHSPRQTYHERHHKSDFEQAGAPDQSVFASTTHSLSNKPRANACLATSFIVLRAQCRGMKMEVAILEIFLNTHAVSFLSFETGFKQLGIA